MLVTISTKTTNYAAICNAVKNGSHVALIGAPHHDYITADRQYKVMGLDDDLDLLIMDDDGDRTCIYLERFKHCFSAVEIDDKEYKASLLDISALASKRLDEMVDDAKRLHTAHAFSVYDVVQWKKKMQNRKFNGPFVITEVLEAPIASPITDLGSYYNERLDIRIGHMKDGVFVEDYVDSRRFEPVTLPVAI